MGFKDFVGSAWNSITNTASNTWNNSKKLAENLYNGAKEYGGKAANWAWNNKGTLLDYGGKAVKAFGVATENPALIGIGMGMSGLGKTINEGEAKDAYQKELEEQRMKQYGNRYVAYSDMPRIHYSKKPYSYILRHHPKFNNDDTFMVRQMINQKHKQKSNEIKKKEKAQKQKENEKKLKEKWEKQSQAKKEREEKKAQEQKEKEQRQKEREEKREQKKQALEQKKKEREQAREQKRKESLKQTKNDIAEARRMGYI